MRATLSIVPLLLAIGLALADEELLVLEPDFETSDSDSSPEQTPTNRHAGPVVTNHGSSGLSAHDDDDDDDDDDDQQPTTGLGEARGSQQQPAVTVTNHGTSGLNVPAYIQRGFRLNAPATSRQVSQMGQPGSAAGSPGMMTQPGMGQGQQGVLGLSGMMGQQGSGFDPSTMMGGQSGFGYGLPGMMGQQGYGYNMPGMMSQLGYGYNMPGMMGQYGNGVPSMAGHSGSAFGMPAGMMGQSGSNLGSPEMSGQMKSQASNPQKTNSQVPQSVYEQSDLTAFPWANLYGWQQPMYSDPGYMNQPWVF